MGVLLTRPSLARYTISTRLVKENTTRASLDAVEASELDQKYPQSVKIWRDAWERFVPFLQLPLAARRVLYITNSVESLNAQLRKVTRNRG